MSGASARAPDGVLRGGVARPLLRLAGPVIAAEAIHTAFHLVDVAWVGRLGVTATGAVMTSMFTLWIAFSLAGLVTTALAAHVSRAIGAGDRAGAGAAVAQAVWLAAGLGVLVAVVGVSGARPLFDLLGTDAATSEQGAAYLRIVALGSPFTFLYLGGGAAMRAAGDTLTPMKISGAAILVNAGLSPLLIYGPGPFPALGVEGSALATVACQAGAAAAYGWLVVRRHPNLPFDRAALGRPRPAALLALSRVGAPYAAIGILFSGVYLWYGHLAALSGAASLAVLGIANRLESVTYLTGDGFASATATFVGQNLGARNPGRAARGAWYAVGFMTAFGVVVGVAMVAAPLPLLGLLTQDPDALRLGVPYLAILALCQPFTGMEGPLGGGFAGAGDTVPPMGIHVATACLRIPLAWWAAVPLGMGLFGIAWTMCLSGILRALVLALWFRRGRWRDTRLPPTQAPLPPADDPDLGAV